MRTRRVAHLVGRFLPVTERWIHAQIRDASDVDAIVLNRGARENEGLFPVTRHVSLADLPASACAREADGWAASGVSPRLLREAKRFGCELVHAHFGTEGTIGVGLAGALGVPLVTSFYGYDVGQLPRDPAWRAAYRHLFARGARFLAEGPALAASLAVLGCPPDRIGLMPLPAAPFRGARHEAPDLPPLVLICGRLVPKKGVDDSLRALACLRDTACDFRAVIIGDGPERERLGRLQQQLGLEAQVDFVGAQSPAEVERWLSESAVLLQMSRTAADGDCEGGSPVILADAAMAGVPAVATRHCDIPFVVLHGRTGLLVESGNAEGAAECLRRLLGCPATRRDMGAEAARFASDRFEPRKCGAKLRAHYDQAIAAYASLPAAAPVCAAAGGPLRLAVQVDFEIRAGRIASLARRVDRNRLPVDVRARALRAIGDAERGKQRPAAAARRYRQWARLQPDEAYAALDEAAAWFAADDGPRALGALARFLDAHPDPVYAIERAEMALAGVSPAQAWRPHVHRRLRSPEAVMAIGLRELRAHLDAGPAQADIRRARRLLDGLLRHPLTRLSASEPAGGRAGLVNEAWTLAYRVASLSAGLDPAARAWARRTFARIAGTADAGPSLRGGACYHLATLHLNEGRTAAAVDAARRCLSLIPDHQAAGRLLVHHEEAA